MAKKYKNSEELRIAIIVRAWKDPEFKARLLKNSRAAFEEMGAELPKEIEVRVVEDKPNKLTFILPRAVSNASGLSDRQLQKLAGGQCGGGVASTDRMRETIEIMRGGGGAQERGECARRIGSSGPA